MQNKHTISFDAYDIDTMELALSVYKTNIVFNMAYEEIYIDDGEFCIDTNSDICHALHFKIQDLSTKRYEMYSLYDLLMIALRDHDAIRQEAIQSDIDEQAHICAYQNEGKL